MSTCIGSQIVRGELFNLKRNSVHGWLDFGDESGVRLDFTGNMSGEFAGQQVRFQAPGPTSAADCSREVIDALANNQIGVTGEMQVRTSPEGKKTLYLEWFSQNGQIIAEIADPILEFGPSEEEEQKQENDQTETHPLLDSDDSLSFLNAQQEDDSDDPYNLFPADLDQQLAESGGGPAEPPAELVDEEIPYELTDESDSTPRTTRPWDEVIPGLDPETKRMYEEWDEVLDGTKDVPFTALFDPPLTLKRPDDITDEAEAEEQLRLLLARLALHCVVIHMCEHFTAGETYRWLLDDLLPEEGVHPQLAPTGFVRHYDTSEHCPTCDAEFEAEWNARKKDDE